MCQDKDNLFFLGGVDSSECSVHKTDASAICFPLEKEGFKQATLLGLSDECYSQLHLHMSV